MKFSDYANSYSFKGKLNIGVLVIHGFTGTPQSVEYYCKTLHKSGFDIEAPVLKTGAFLNS